MQYIIESRFEPGYSRLFNVNDREVSMVNDSGRTNFFQLFRVYWLIPIIFTYALGVSLVHYLGGNLDVINLVLGIFLCLFMSGMRYLLNAFFDHPDSSFSTLNRDDKTWEVLKQVKRNLLLQYSLLVLTGGAALTAILIAREGLSPAGLLILGLALLGNFFSASPPLRMDRSGYGDLVEGIVTVNLVPGLAVSLQKMNVPILLLQLTIPLLMIYLAVKIEFAFRDYGFDIMHARKSLLTRISWQKGVILHNLLILGAFVLVGVFLLLGLPWSLTWPVLLALPLGVHQVWQMLRIANGQKPGWKLLLWMGLGLVLMMAYLIQVPLWS